MPDIDRFDAGANAQMALIRLCAMRKEIAATILGLTPSERRAPAETVIRTLMISAYAASSGRVFSA